MKRILTPFIISTFLIRLVSAEPPESLEFSWEVIDKRPIPSWFVDAKFGIFIHWGVYSVPSWTPSGTYSEWYQYWLETKTLFGNGSFSGTEVYDFHNKLFGKDVSYYDLAHRFKAELYQPSAWANLFKRSGARYVIMTSKHHDGFTMWPSPEASRSRGFPWNSVEVGPERDLVGEFMEAMRDAGLRPGLYYSLYEWFHPYYRSDISRFVDEHYLPQIKDLVNRYRPDILWADGEWEHPAGTWKSIEFLNWLYNQSPIRETVLVNDRWGRETRHNHGGYYTTEYETDGVTGRHPWEECRGMALSFGYNRDETIDDYNSAKALILMLVDVVSRGGNLLLDIGPAADGSIPVIMQERLLQIGQWLERNGEAIFGTRPWTRPYQLSDGEKVYEFERTETRRYISGEYILKQTVDPDPGFQVKEVFFTQKEGSIYAIVPSWPKGSHLRLRGFPADENTSIKLLGFPGELKATREEADLLVEVPPFTEDLVTEGQVYAFKISKSSD